LCCVCLKDIAAADLRSCHPIRLGLVLNFSVFYYEILNRYDEGLDMAKQVCVNPILFVCFTMACLFCIKLCMFVIRLSHEGYDFSDL